MGEIKLITVERNSKLKREDVRKAVAEAFKNYRKLKPRQAANGNQHKAA